MATAEEDKPNDAQAKPTGVFGKLFGPRKKFKAAKMGLQLEMYYNEELKCWVQPGEEDQKRKEIQALSAPPPTVASITSLASSASNLEGPPAAGALKPSSSRPGLTNRYAAFPSLATTSDLAGSTSSLMPGGGLSLRGPPGFGASQSALLSKAPGVFKPVGTFVPSAPAAGSAATSPTHAAAAGDGENQREGVASEDTGSARAADGHQKRGGPAFFSVPSFADSSTDQGADQTAARVGGFGLGHAHATVRSPKRASYEGGNFDRSSSAPGSARAGAGDGLVNDPVFKEVLSFWKFYRKEGYDLDAMKEWVRQYYGDEYMSHDYETLLQDPHISRVAADHFDANRQTPVPSPTHSTRSRGDYDYEPEAEYDYGSQQQGYYPDAGEDSLAPGASEAAADSLVRAATRDDQEFAALMHGTVAVEGQAGEMGTMEYEQYNYQYHGQYTEYYGQENNQGGQSQQQPGKIPAGLGALGSGELVMEGGDSSQVPHISELALEGNPYYSGEGGLGLDEGELAAPMQQQLEQGHLGSGAYDEYYSQHQNQHQQNEGNEQQWAGYEVGADAEGADANGYPSYQFDGAGGVGQPGEQHYQHQEQYGEYDQQQYNDPYNTTHTVPQPGGMDDHEGGHGNGIGSNPHEEPVSPEPGYQSYTTYPSAGMGHHHQVEGGIDVGEYDYQQQQGYGEVEGGLGGVYYGQEGVGALASPEFGPEDEFMSPGVLAKELGVPRDNLVRRLILDDEHSIDTLSSTSEHGYQDADRTTGYTPAEHAVSHLEESVHADNQNQEQHQAGEEYPDGVHLPPCEQQQYEQYGEYDQQYTEYPQEEQQQVEESMLQYPGLGQYEEEVGSGTYAEHDMLPLPNNQNLITMGSGVGSESHAQPASPFTPGAAAAAAGMLGYDNPAFEQQQQQYEQHQQEDQTANILGVEVDSGMQAIEAEQYQQQQQHHHQQQEGYSYPVAAAVSEGGVVLDAATVAAAAAASTAERDAALSVVIADVQQRLFAAMQAKEDASQALEFSLSRCLVLEEAAHNVQQWEAALQQSTAGLTLEVQELENKVEELQRELEGAQQAQQAAEAAAAQLEAQRDQAQAALVLEEQETTDLRAALEESSNAVESLNAVQERVSELEGALAAAQHELAIAQQAQQEAADGSSSWRQQAQQAQQEFSTLEAALSEEQGRNAILSQKVEDAKAALDAVHAEMEERIRTSEAEIRDLMKEALEFAAQEKESELAALRQTTSAELAAAKESFEQEIQLSLAAVIADKDGIIAQLETSLQETQTLTSDLEHRATTAEAEHAQQATQLETLQTKVKDLEKKFILAKKKIQMLQQEQTGQQALQAALEQQCAQLESELVAAREEVERKGQGDGEALEQVQNLQAALEQAQQDVSTLDAAFRAAQSDVINLQEALQTAHATISELESTSSSSHTAVQELQEEIYKLSTENAVLQEHVAIAQAAADAAQGQLAGLAAENTSLLEGLSSAEATQRELNAEVERLHSVLQATKQNNEERRASAGQLAEQLAEAQEEAQRAAGLLVALQAECDAAHAALEEERSCGDDASHAVAAAQEELRTLQAALQTTEGHLSEVVALQEQAVVEQSDTLMTLRQQLATATQQLEEAALTQAATSTSTTSSSDTSAGNEVLLGRIAEWQAAYHAQQAACAAGETPLVQALQQELVLYSELSVAVLESMSMAAAAGVSVLSGDVEAAASAAAAEELKKYKLQLAKAKKLRANDAEKIAALQRDLEAAKITTATPSTSEVSTSNDVISSLQDQISSLQTQLQSLAPLEHQVKELQTAAAESDATLADCLSRWSIEEKKVKHLLELLGEMGLPEDEVLGQLYEMEEMWMEEEREAEGVNEDLT